MEYPYDEGNVRRKAVPQHDTQITPVAYGELPGEYESSYRPDSQAYHEKTAYGTATPDPPRGRVPNYKPAPLKWPFLCLLGVILLGLIALTEYSCRVLPSEAGRVPLPNANAIKIAMGAGAVGKRQGSGTTPFPGDGSNTTPSPAGNTDKTETPPKDAFGGDGAATVTSPDDGGYTGPTVTYFTPTPSDYNPGGTVTIDDGVSAGGGGETIVMETPKVSVLTDPQGVPTATLTSTPPPISTPTEMVLTDANGIPTATVSTNVPVAPITTILTDTNGVPTATVVEYPVVTGKGSPNTRVYFISKGDYFIGYFLPAIICVLLTIPIRMIELSAKQFQPFHQLTHEYGAPARDSLVLQTGGVQGVLTSFRSLFGGQALIFLTTTLALCSMLLVPVAVEAISLKVHGTCSQLSFRGCAMTLGVFLIPARVTIGILAFMVVVLIVTLIVLRDWRSGVAANPWSVAGIAVLSTNPDVRALFASLPTGRIGRVSDRKLLDALDGRMFKLGYFFNRHGQPEYGIMVQNEAGQPLQNSDGPAGVYAQPHPEIGQEAYRKKAPHHLPFLMLSYWGRILFLLLITGLLGVILYYNKTSGNTPFELFMDMQSFGVRFLFTALGVIITWFWTSFFSSLALISPYHVLSQSPQPAGRSVLRSPPMTAFTGVFSAIRRRHGFLTVVAATTILSEFMPILLNNVPFRITQTWAVHVVCTWLSVGILCIMWLVVVGSFFVRWPHLPVDPATVAGAMYYVCDSWMMWAFEGLATLPREERDWKVGETGLKFEFGDIAGVSGIRRIGVDGIRDSHT